MQFRSAGNDPEPWKPDAALVAQGIYRFTRNPMYLGMALAHLGLALALDSLGALLAWPVAIVLIDRLVIAREERHLAARFGPAFEEYRTRVRRWI
ncbi:methyltransferase family protein [Croceicoccus marinus]|uniref:methyltransferase family protein n=1 Tax=Croceicoccus marinus TaxID=450378 RepID=UPI000A4377EF|nr:isoprenylcysteine carboxylmethyltransferase family protein [Croceicoccus marinus]